MTRSASETAAPRQALAKTTKTLKEDPDGRYGQLRFHCHRLRGGRAIAALSYIAAAKEQGAKPRVAVLESAPAEQRGGATRWTTARFRAREDFSARPSIRRQGRKAVPRTCGPRLIAACWSARSRELRLLEAHGVKLLHFGPPVAYGRPSTKSPPMAAARRLSKRWRARSRKPAPPRFCIAPRAVRLSLADDGRVEGVVVRGEDGLLRTLSARAVTLACGGFEGN